MEKNNIAFPYNNRMHHRFWSQNLSIKQNKSPDNHVDIEKLTKIEIETVKKDYAIIRDIQAMLKIDYGAVN